VKSHPKTVLQSHTKTLLQYLHKPLIAMAIVGIGRSMKHIS